MRLLRLLAALAVTAIGVLLWAAPAMAQDPKITVYPQVAANEDQIGIVLENVDCDHNADVKLFLNGKEPTIGNTGNVNYGHHFFGVRHVIVELIRPVIILPAGHYDVAVVCHDTGGKELTFRSGFERLPPNDVVRPSLVPMWLDPAEGNRVGVDNYERCTVTATIDGRAVRLITEPTFVYLDLPQLAPGVHPVELNCDGNKVTYPLVIDGVTSGTPAISRPAASSSSGYSPVSVFLSVPTPQTMNVSVIQIVAAVLLGGVVILLIGFPAEFVNKTIEANEDVINSWARRVRIPLQLKPWQWFVVYCGLTAVFTTFVDPLAGFSSATLVTLVSFVIAVPLTTLVFSGTREFLTRKATGVPGIIHTVPRALLLALIMTVVSRIAGFQPGYVYGLVAGYVGLRERRLSARHDSATVIGGSAALFVLSVVAWIGLGAVHLDANLPGASFPLRVWDGVLAATFLLGVQTLVFGLIPLRFLDGYVLREWKIGAWAATYAPGIFLFILLLGFNSETARQRGVAGGLISSLVLFAGFGVVSIAFWGLFQLRGRQTAPAAAVPAQPTPQDTVAPKPEVPQ